MILFEKPFIEDLRVVKLGQQVFVGGAYFHPGLVFLLFCIDYLREIIARMKVRIYMHVWKHVANVIEWQADNYRSFRQNRQKSPELDELNIVAYTEAGVVTV